MRVYQTVPDVATYPEHSPWDYDPPLYNFVPEPEDQGQYDTLELRESALALAQRTDCNPLAGMYGCNPLHITNPLALGLRPWDSCAEQAPPLPQIALPEELQFVQQLNHGGNTAVFIVRVNNKDLVMKIFPDRPPLEEEGDNIESWPGKPDPRVLFRRESNAYSHLVHYGACERGVAPYCYGWCSLSLREIHKILSVPSISKTARALASEERPPTALLIQYFPDAEQISELNVTPEIAQNALKALHACHTSYVLHGDVHRRNILVLPGGRVVWIDFDHSECAPVRAKVRSIFLDELKEGWDYMYDRLLPDARIGYHHA